MRRRWVQKLSKEFPTLAFHASLTNSFGKGALINLLRQFSQLHKDKKNISIGLIGEQQRCSPTPFHSPTPPHRRAGALSGGAQETRLSVGCGCDAQAIRTSGRAR